MACTVVVGKAGVVSVVSTTSGDASPLPASTLRPSTAPPRGFLLLLLGPAAVSTGALRLQLPSPPLLQKGAASVASRPQGRELALKNLPLIEELGEEEGDMLLLPSQTVDPAATATPYSDATQVRAQC